MNKRLKLNFHTGLVALLLAAPQYGFSQGEAITIDIPTLPADASFDIAYDVTVNNPGGDLNTVFDPEVITHQASISGMNFTTANTMAMTPVPINDAPVVVVPASVSTAKATPVSITGVSVGDIDASQLSVTLTSSRGNILLADSVASGLVAGDITANGSTSVIASGTPAQFAATFGDAGGLQYTGFINLVGTDSIGLNVSDGGGTGFNNAPFDVGTATGSITVNLTGTILDDWRNTEFDEADLLNPALEATVWGDNANPDQDPFANLFEFLHGLDPQVATFVPQVTLGTVVVGVDTFATYTFKRRIDLGDTTLSVMVSDERGSGFSALGAGQISNTAIPADQVFQTTTATDDTPVTAAQPRYGKVRIEAAP